MLGATQLLLAMVGLAVAFYVPLGTDCGTIALGSFAVIQVRGCGVLDGVVGVKRRLIFR